MNKNVERTENRCGVRDFAQAMQDKLDRKMEEGRGGWWDPKQCTIESLNVMLADHIKNGDMVDIGNFAMMIWNRQRQK
jgi:hypothetical protein